MNASEDYCELCDLPRSQCIHGRPPPEPPKPAATTAPRTRKATGSSGRPATGSTTRATTRATKVAPPARTLRWTPPEVFKPLILEVLEQAGGELEADDLFRALEVVAADRLRPEDSERTPEGELRWRYAARRARVALVDEGRMTKGTPGLWQLA